MHADIARAEATITRRVFPGWSITIPAAFAETFVNEGGYWHAYDAHRSASMTSMVVEDDRRPVPASMIVDRFTPSKGKRVDELPPGLLGWAIEAKARRPARASRMLSGMLASDGRVLIVTITSDDRDWARRTWLSIRRWPPGQRAP